MTKPVGPICSLDCKYCFYLEKENFFRQTNILRCRTMFADHRATRCAVYRGILGANPYLDDFFSSP